MKPSVVVVGGGVIGRTCALELARAGHAVTLVTADAPEDTTSARAGALWMPFHAAPIDQVLRWSARSLPRLEALGGDPASGVRMGEGRMLFRTDARDISWMPHVPGASLVDDPTDAPAGVTSYARATVPLIDMSRHLPWLQAQGAALGVAEVRRRIASVDEARGMADLVLLATALATDALVPGAGMYPIQGQIVRVRNPGGVPWILDGENPAGLSYIIPRVDDVVLGGTDIPHADSTELDPELEQRILATCAALVPALAGQPVMSRAVGLRPARDTVRLEREGDVIHCYGHGGSGVTMAFGCAEDVVALAAAA